MLRVKHKPYAILGGLLLIAVTVTTLGIFWVINHSAVLVDTSGQKPQINKLLKVVKIESNVLFTGNSFWGRYTNDKALKSDNPYQYPFARLGEFGRDQYDAWVTGLECPVTEKGKTMTSRQMEATLTFNCDPAYLGEFTKWFNIVSLANNHTDNMGEDGFSETKTNLNKYNIQYFGHYNPDVIEDQCEVISLPVKATYSDKSVKKASLPIGMCGYHGVFKIPSQESIAEIAKYAKKLPVLVLPHAGAEYKPMPDQIKTTMYHGMIDAGADMVLGDHPHWIQNTEVYKNKLIVYSMGNFMFDQQADSEVTRSAAINVKLNISSQNTDSLTAWLKLGETCKTFKDTCLDSVTKLDKLDIKYNYNAIATADKGYQAYPAPELQNSVEDRLGWQKSMEILGNNNDQP